MFGINERERDIQVFFFVWVQNARKWQEGKG
jgi:hypothetical protein